jgi:hypothetical protein
MNSDLRPETPMNSGRDPKTSWFNRHTNEAGESYFDHLQQAMILAKESFSCGIMFFLHGLFPFVFTYSGGNRLISLAEKLRLRREAAFVRSKEQANIS